MRSTRLALLAAVVLLCAVSCSGQYADSPGPAAGSPEPPVGAIWRWISVEGAEPLEVPSPGRYTLELKADGRYGVRADCNTGGGTYEIDGTSLRLAPGPMTLAACGPESLGGRFAALLADAAGFSRDGDTLTLELPGGAMRFEAMKQVALAGSSWLVRGYNNGKGGVVSVRSDTMLHLDFTDEGSAAGSAGCNDFTAAFEVEGDRIAIGPAAVTRKMCVGEGVMEQETAFLDALSSVARHEHRGERLQLRRADGALALDLVSVVTGSVLYRTRQALDPGAEIEVLLQDVSLADAPARTIGRLRIPADGKQVPIEFEIPFDPAEIDPRHSYSVRATITREERLLFTSTQAYPVITRDAPRYGVEVLVEPAQR